MAQYGAVSLSPEALETLKVQIMTEIEAKLSQKDESLWKRGQFEIKRLDAQQQEMAATIAQLQESNAQLAVENQKLRHGLLEVTSKFEVVLMEMREALRAMPRRKEPNDVQVSPTPSVASTSADAKHYAELTPPGSAGAKLAAGMAEFGWQQPATPALPSWVLAESPDGYCMDGAGERPFCTPPRMGAGAANSLQESASTAAPGSSEVHAAPRGAGSPAVLSLASALTSAKSASSGLKRLQLAECLQPDAVEGAVGSPARPTRPTEGGPEPAARHATGLRVLELVKEAGFVTLGMEVNTDGPFLKVENIDEHGLVGRHNQRQTSEASKVHVGDCIMEANGVRGDPNKMLQECKARQRIVFGISNGDAASETPLAEARSPEKTIDDKENLHASDGDTAAGADAAAGSAGLGRAEEPISQLRPEAQVFVPLAAAAEVSSAVPVSAPPGLPEAPVAQSWGGLAAGMLTVVPPPALFMPGDLSPSVLAAAAGQTGGACEHEEIKRTLFP